MAASGVHSFVCTPRASQNSIGDLISVWGSRVACVVFEPVSYPCVAIGKSEVACRVWSFACACSGGASAPLVLRACSVS